MGYAERLHGVLIPADCDLVIDVFRQFPSRLPLKLVRLRQGVAGIHTFNGTWSNLRNEVYQQLAILLSKLARFAIIYHYDGCMGTAHKVIAQGRLMELLSQEGGEAEVRGLLGVDSELIEQALKGEMGAVCVNLPTLERTLELLDEAHFLEGGLARRKSLLHQAKAIDNLMEWNDYEKAMHHLRELSNQCEACLNTSALFLVREIVRAIQSEVVALPTVDDEL